MPKTCPKCERRHSGVAVRCECGFDLSGVAAVGPVAPVALSARRHGTREPAPPRLAGRLLVVGEVIAVTAAVGCAVVGLFALVSIAFAFAVGRSERDWLEGMSVGLGAVVGFCYWVAMFAVFREVRRLRVLGELAGEPPPAPADPVAAER